MKPTKHKDRRGYKNIGKIDTRKAAKDLLEDEIDESLEKQKPNIQFEPINIDRIVNLFHTYLYGFNSTCYMGKYDTLITNPKDSELLAIAEINELAEHNRLVRLGMKLTYRLTQRPVIVTDPIEDIEFEDEA